MTPLKASMFFLGVAVSERARVDLLMQTTHTARAATQYCTGKHMVAQFVHTSKQSILKAVDCLRQLHPSNMITPSILLV